MEKDFFGVFATFVRAIVYIARAYLCIEIGTVGKSGKGE